MRIVGIESDSRSGSGNLSDVFGVVNLNRPLTALKQKYSPVEQQIELEETVGIRCKLMQLTCHVSPMIRYVAKPP